MPDPALVRAHARRWRRPSLLVLAGLLLATTASALLVRPLEAATPDHREQLRFMWAMAGQESGWDYYARNASSGAFGKYQIMPFNWPVWAQQYLGDAGADQTPRNQETVAYGKVRDLYRWLGSWKRVAYWWLTGRTERDERRWSSYARGYVTNIMRLRQRAPAGGSPMPPRSAARPSKGDWRRAAEGQQLRLTAAGRRWSAGGRVRDGQVLKVRQSKTARNGERWLRVLTADGRLGWLKQRLTLPARRPAEAARWRDVDDRGGRARGSERRHVRPLPR